MNPLQSDLTRPQDRIVLARVDNRLIHGQVLEAWLPFVQANSIVVASDEVAGKPLQKRLMKASVPSDIPVTIGSLAEIADYFAQSEISTRILLLFPSPIAAWQGYRLGIPLTELNLGNIPGGEGKCRLSCTVSLSEDELTILDQFEADGVRVNVRCLPTEEVLDWRAQTRGGKR